MAEFTVTKAEVKQNMTGDYELTLIVPKSQRIAVQGFYDTMVGDGKIMFAKIEKKRNKRSLDANAYMWVLCQKIADMVGNTKENIYLEAVRNVGRFEIIPIRKDAVEFWIKAWKEKGIGWYSEVMQESKLDGYENVISYYGSSVYDTKSMSVLLDYIVQEAKQLKIDTMTPSELEMLKQNWK